MAPVGSPLPHRARPVWYENGWIGAGRSAHISSALIYHGKPIDRGLETTSVKRLIKQAAATGGHRSR